MDILASWPLLLRYKKKTILEQILKITRKIIISGSTKIEVIKLQ